MWNAIKHGLGNVLNFQGRDARQAFWFYVLFLYIVTLVLSMVVIVPMMIQGVMQGIQQGMDASKAGDPAAAQAAVDAAMMNSMSDMMSNTMSISMVTGIIMLAGIAAAFVRRLHDSDLSGLWALLPGTIQIANLYLAPQIMRGMVARMADMRPGDPAASIRAMQGSFGAASLFGWAGIVVVVLLGIRKSTPGPNRFGEAPSWPERLRCRPRTAT